MAKKILLVAIATLLVTAMSATADDALKEAIAADYDHDLRALFEHFHRHPELSFRELQTAERLAAELRDAGVEVTEGVGGTGIVGMLRNGDGPTVLVRADMDGLPIQEDTGLPYASTATQ
ncbi:MAG: amidohydrolase, partial [Thermoanaerobaculia bacterium]